MKVKVLNLNNSKLSEQTFDCVAENLKIHRDLIGAVIKWQLANRRGFSTAKTKVISEISATGKKPFAQKGRGSARQGSLVAAQFVGGAKAHGPRPRDFSFTMPKKMIKKALSLVLKDKFANDRVCVIEGLDELPISTNQLDKKLKQYCINEALVACSGCAENFNKSVRNIKRFKTLNASALNVYDILNYDFLLLDREAFDKVINEVL